MGTNRWNYKHQKRMNNISYLTWFERLASIVQSRFIWKGLPATCDVEMIEYSLFRQGKVCLFEDEALSNGLEKGVVSLPFIPTNTLTPYGYPSAVQPFSWWGGVQYDIIPLEDVAIGYDVIGKSRWSSYEIVDYYAMRLSDIQRSIDINLLQQKALAGAFIGNEAQKNAMQAAFERLEGNGLFIVVDKDAIQNKVSPVGTNATILDSFNFDIPYIADKLQIQKQMMLNEFLTAIGVENTNSDKRERLVADETNANIGALENARFVSLMARQKLCDQAWNKLGVDINVHWNSSIDTLLNRAFNNQTDDESGVDDND